MARRGMFYVMNQLHKGWVRVYDVGDVAQSSLRVQTATGVAAFNLVAPGAGDTGIRVMTAAGVREIKSYLNASYEDVSRRDIRPSQTYGEAETIYYERRSSLTTSPNIMVTPRARTYQGRFVINIQSGASDHIVLNRDWYLWVDNGSGLYNTGLSTYVVNAGIDYAVDTSFKEMTIYRFTFLPGGRMASADFNSTIFCHSWDYKVNEWTIH